MQIVIDISKGRYDEIMSMDWNNCRLLFDEEIRAIHDGKALEQEPCDDCVSRQAVLDVLDKSKYSNEFCEEHHIDWSINLGMAHIVVNELKPVTLQHCVDAVSRQAVLEVIRKCHCEEWVKADIGAPIESLQSVTPQPNPNIKALGEDIRICQKSITDKKVLIGFNMAVALCNKHLAESEVQE